MKYFLSQNIFHLLPVSLTPVINLYFQISLQIFVQILNTVLRGSGENDSWKNLRSKISRQTPFKVVFETAQELDLIQLLSLTQNPLF